MGRTARAYRGRMTTDFIAAWVPYEPTKYATDAVAAVRWAEAQAAQQGGRVVLVSENKYQYVDHPLFKDYDRQGRHASRRSPYVKVSPGAVVAHRPGPEVLWLATGLARGNALVAVEDPSWSLAGWARATGALNLYTKKIAKQLDPRLRERLQELASQSYNGFRRGPDRDRALRVLAAMHADRLLDRDIVLSALSAFDEFTPSVQQTIAKLIDEILLG